jgi:hypothetical protein
MNLIESVGNFFASLSSDPNKIVAFVAMLALFVIPMFLK